MEYEVPQIELSEAIKTKKIELVDFSNLGNKELEEYLSYFGSWKSYLDGIIGQLEANKDALDSSFEEGLIKRMYELARDRMDKGEKKYPKELLRGEALSSSEPLSIVRKEVIELQKQVTRLSGYRNQMKSSYDTISRIVAIRTQAYEGV